jgi:hypothetical protein
MAYLVESMRVLKSQFKSLSIAEHAGHSAAEPTSMSCCPRVPEPLITSTAYELVGKRLPCVLMGEDGNVSVDSRASVNFFVAHPRYQQVVHQHFMTRAPGGCFVTDPNVPTPEGIRIVKDCSLRFCPSKGEQAVGLGHHYSIRPNREMSLADLEAKLAQLHSVSRSADAAAGDQELVQPDPPEPGYPADKAVAYGCIALRHLYQDPVTSPNQALRAWAYHHHLAATDMKLGQLKEEPLPLLALLAEAVAAQPQTDDLTDDEPDMTGLQLGVHVTYLAQPMRLDNRPVSRAAMLLALIIIS